MNIVKRTPPCWFYLLLVVWGLLVAGLWIVEARAQENDLELVQCASFSSEIGNTSFVQYLGQLKGQNAWLGYPAKDEIPIDPNHAKDVYLFVYQNIEPFADQNGEWMGNHPCGAYLITPEDALRLLAYSKDG